MNNSIRNIQLVAVVIVLISTIIAFGQYSPAQIELKIDGKEMFNGEIMVCAIANGMYFGGGMKIAPDAKCDDNLLDVVIQKPQAFIPSLIDLPKLYSGEHVKESFVEHFKGQRIDLTLKSSDPVHLEIDGETIGSLDAQFDIVPKCLNILI